MKNKIGIKTRVFLSFSIFIIILVNIFAYLLYFFVSDSINSINYKNIKSEYETIKTFIDLQKSNIFSLPKNEIEKMNDLGFFFYIGNNDENLKKNYKLGLNLYSDKEIIFREDYKGYNVIIGKNIDDLNKLRNSFIEVTILLNIVLIIGIFILSYFITKLTLIPLVNLSDYLKKYKIKDTNLLIKNNYGDSEIGVLTDSINEFIEENKRILDSQVTFIQDVNHELKTPLMQIDSSIEMLEDKISDEKIINRLASIKDSTKNINDIITNLGFILKGEEKIIKKEKIDIYNYLENFIKNYKSLASKKNIEINIQKKADLIIENNTYYLDRLFGNLLSNAIFYNNGNNTINIIIESDNVKVIDKGIGIDKKELNSIFDRFYRNPNSGLFYSNGNGLGLVIVKKICNLFGWKIEIESEIGIGSSFVIRFK